MFTWQVDVFAFHKRTERHCTMQFIVTADNRSQLLQIIQDEHDLSGIEIRGHQFKQLDHTQRSFCVNTIFGRV